MQKFHEEMGHTIGYMGVDLESRDEIIRREESNYGNFAADLIRTEYAADFAIFNAGTLRINRVIPAGPISLLHIQETFPFHDIVMVLKMSGHLIK